MRISYFWKKNWSELIPWRYEQFKKWKWYRILISHWGVIQSIWKFQNRIGEQKYILGRKLPTETSNELRFIETRSEKKLSTIFSALVRKKSIFCLYKILKKYFQKCCYFSKMLVNFEESYFYMVSESSDESSRSINNGRNHILWSWLFFFIAQCNIIS
jgi:hypothetical protein